MNNKTPTRRRRKPPAIIGVHPYANVFPMLGADELTDLAADISRNGLQTPVVVTPEGLLLEGRNRWEACKRAGVEPTATVYDGDDPASFVLSANVSRRHLTPGQRAVAAAVVLKEAGRRIEGRWVRGSVVNPESGTSGITDSKTWQNTMSRAGTILDYAPELADAVIAGVMKFDRAFARPLSHPPRQGVRLDFDRFAQVRLRGAQLGNLDSQRHHLGVSVQCCDPLAIRRPIRGGGHQDQRVGGRPAHRCDHWGDVFGPVLGREFDPLGQAPLDVIPGGSLVSVKHSGANNGHATSSHRTGITGGRMPARVERKTSSVGLPERYGKSGPMARQRAGSPDHPPSGPSRQHQMPTAPIHPPYAKSLVLQHIRRPLLNAKWPLPQRHWRRCGGKVASGGEQRERHVFKYPPDTSRWVAGFGASNPLSPRAFRQIEGNLL